MALKQQILTRAVSVAQGDFVLCKLPPDGHLQFVVGRALDKAADDILSLRILHVIRRKVSGERVKTDRRFINAITAKVSPFIGVQCSQCWIVEREQLAVVLNIPTAQLVEFLERQA